MSVSDIDVKQVYTGNGVTTAFAIPFYFIEGEESVIKVYLREETRDILPAAITGNDITAPNNFFSTGDIVTLSTTGALPSPLLTTSQYYVIFVNNTTIRLAASAADAIANNPVTLTNSGTGTMTITAQKPYENLQTLTTHYSLSGGPPVTTVNTVTAPLAGQELIVIRESALTQDLDFVETSPWSPLLVEKQFDRLVLLLQEQGERLGRAFVAPAGESATDFSLPPSSPGQAIGWSEDGTTLINVDAGAGGGGGTDYSVDIAANTALIATNTANIATNTTNIGTNTTNIATNTADILALQASALTNATIALTNNGTVNGPNITNAAVIHFEIERTDTVNTRLALGTIKIMERGGTYYVSTPDFFIPTGNPPGVTFGMFGNQLQVTCDNMTGGTHTGTFIYTLINI